MNREVLYRIAFIGVVMLTMFCAGYGCGRDSQGNGSNRYNLSRVDTLVVRDTITSEKPVFVEKRVVDTICVPVHFRDTTKMIIRDTIFVRLPREQVVWQDAWSKVYASGFLPQIDSVQHFTTERVVSRTEVIRKHPRWSVGLQAGYGVGIRGGVLHPMPYVGVGLTYGIASW